MVSATTRAEMKDPLASLTVGSSTSRSSAKTFAKHLATAVEGSFKQSGKASATDINVKDVSGRNSGGSQFFVRVTAGSGSAGAATNTNVTATTIIKAPGAPSSTAAPPSDEPTMLGMGPVAGMAPVQQVVVSQPVCSEPVTEADAYWAAQPAAVQALRDMPDGAAKDQLALKLANQGYSIDTQIMVWGWDPQMTMTVRENQGYSWVPSYGQSNIAVGPGLSMPGNPNTYSPGNAPSGAIQVSTAFAAGTIQNPLVQTDSTNT